MQQVKKAYEQVYALLEANKNKRVNTILPELVELMTAKTNQQTFIKDQDGNVTHVFCYYHKLWEPVAKVEYGKKASNKSTGLNTMCKEGVSNWTKQQRVMKQAKTKLLEDVASGEVPANELQDQLDAIELEAKSIVPRVDGIGSETI